MGAAPVCFPGLSMDAPRGNLARGALLPFVRAHILFLAHRVVWLRHFVPELPLNCSSVTGFLSREHEPLKSAESGAFCLPGAHL